MAAAAAAAAAIGSCFSTAATTTCIRSKQVALDFVLKIGHVRTLQVASVSHSHSIEFLSTGVISHKWRTPRFSAAVAQEESATVIQTEPESVEEAEDIVDEKGEDQVLDEEEADQAPLNTKLYFGNLPYNCDSAQLAGIIQDYGSPEMVEIYGGRTLRVNFSDKPRPREPMYPETDYKLFVGNLSWSVTSESLLQVFQEYGNVVGARVLYDGETGRSRGYGFVSYSSKPEMDAALESLNGVVPLSLSLAFNLVSITHPHKHACTFVVYFEHAYIESRSRPTWCKLKLAKACLSQSRLRDF
ncbi:29 kDa ribonucleoprotein A, chloroplastic isoform X2 [Telopea speciosissima]|uniref:29 kDa ribonucleoprotein A, chloroplastic isoform X2 n=1 Tax=Telopea speciosissima TaxID=54955 RepID=UPI001CC46DA3|nr:29 kDa ribonucleoprotein A, chloroplastic isoform X2 [Telopea speciosissima]